MRRVTVAQRSSVMRAVFFVVVAKMLFETKRKKKQRTLFMFCEPSRFANCRSRTVAPSVHDYRRATHTGLFSGQNIAVPTT